MPISETYLIDNLEYMRTVPDKFFELAIVDPPYGININANMGRKKNKRKIHKDVKWDSTTPPPIYFEELFRISKNQIIWGGNYFDLPISQGWIFWDKEVPSGVSFSDGELAWTSFNQSLKKVYLPYCGFIGKEKTRIHPTQKPVALYKWILSNYAKGGDKIFDSHLGSQSSRIATYEIGLDFWGCELDEEYFNAGNKRFESYKAQQKLFTFNQQI